MFAPAIRVVRRRVVVDVAFDGVLAFDLFGWNAGGEAALRLANPRIAFQIVREWALALAVLGFRHDYLLSARTNELRRRTPTLVALLPRSAAVRMNPGLRIVLQAMRLTTIRGTRLGRRAFSAQESIGISGVK